MKCWIWKCWIRHWTLDLKNVGSEVLDSRLDVTLCLKCWIWRLMSDVGDLDEMLDLKNVGSEVWVKCWMKCWI
jgi:hypothetical protein